jgi:hypothetical protein
MALKLLFGISLFQYFQNISMNTNGHREEVFSSPFLHTDMDQGNGIALHIYAPWNTLNHIVIYTFPCPSNSILPEYLHGGT